MVGTREEEAKKEVKKMELPLGEKARRISSQGLRCDPFNLVSLRLFL